MLALAPEPAHSYRIMQLINDLFATYTRIGRGTLYRALHRLVVADMIVEARSIRTRPTTIVGDSTDLPSKGVARSVPN